MSDNPDDFGTLTDMDTGEPIRPATREEHQRSLAAGEGGAFCVDSHGNPRPPGADPAVFGPLRTVYVAGGPEVPAGPWFLKTADPEMVEWLTRESRLSTLFNGERLAEATEGGVRIDRLDLLLRLDEDDDGSITYDQDGTPEMRVEGVGHRLVRHVA